MKRVEVVAAVIVDRVRGVLCARRSGGVYDGIWEFPGGKIEFGESGPVALEREIREELGCCVAVGAPIETTVHTASHLVIDLTTYWCEVMVGEPEPEALEHSEVRWVAAGDLGGLEWAPADVPSVERVVRELGEA